ncbi:MAG: TRAP transporter substrate-binding protein [Firmicutes bacterium]|nr:TRAP transporter substrate-binding protein [Bacillota bacterium]
MLPVAATLLAFTLTGCAARVGDSEQVSPGEKLVLRFSHVVADDTPKGWAARRFAALVHERTGGRVEVQVFPNSTLYKDGEEMDALRSGAVHFIAPTTSKISRMFPEWQLFDLPYAFESAEQVHRAVDGALGERLYRQLEAEGLKPLAFWDNGFKQMTNSVRPLIWPGDFRGLTFRVQIDSPLLEAQFRALGAEPRPLPFNEVRAALAAGAVDGQENTMSNTYSQEFYKEQRYMTVSNHGYMGYVVLTTASFWESLPPDIRRVLEETMAEVTYLEREKALAINRRDFEAMKGEGRLAIHLQTDEERASWRRALEPVYREFEARVGPEPLALLAELRGPSRTPTRG